MSIANEVKEIQKKELKKRGRKSKSETNKEILNQLHKKNNQDEIAEDEVQRRSRGKIKRIKNKIEIDSPEGKIIIERIIETDIEDPIELEKLIQGVSDGK